MFCAFLEQNTHLRALIGLSGAGRRVVGLAFSLNQSLSLNVGCQKGGSSSPPPNDPAPGALPHGSSLASRGPPCGRGAPPPEPPPKSALELQAEDLVTLAETWPDVSGDYKRHWCYAQLIKHFPAESRRAISRAIEAALPLE